ncbi:organic hydroperoxide resistance protein [Virgibacillus alimentarius]|uniref:Ohr subfamily peroxiredoxin n=1 Tax=Virgibacillus alimentarius TaxID=698769 RepID=A0ABS4S832_9BACI|nr:MULTISPECIES: organic hydroperoxide resistance protein [Virgibacillus]MBP2257652.1 Ohr subfamily peroxiredoxin [Virgibacillus alimentarius]HLR68486.1 organic hydroperoxide resistance protein [Virgibacillus sp.]
MNPLYTASSTVRGGRNGRVISDDKIIDMPLVMPKSLGGGGGEGTNPEQLFSAGYAACFDSALNLAARKQRIKIDETAVKAQVSIGKDTDGGFALTVALDVKIPGVEQEVAEQLVESAHQICPYSKATRGNIAVDLKAKGVER